MSFQTFLKRIPAHFFAIICCITFSSYAQQMMHMHAGPVDRAIAMNIGRRYRSFPVWLLGREQLAPALMENILSHCPEEIIQFIEGMKHQLSSGGPIIWDQALLVGKPGTGKSSIAKTMAAQCKLPFFLYNAGHLKNEYQNSGHRNIELLFAHALNYERPCVVIIEKIEFLFNETAPDYHTNISMLKQIQDTMERYPVVFICTYNKGIHDFPEEIEGRFRHSVIDVPLPNYEQRVQLIEYFSQTTSSRSGRNFSSKAIASKTDGFSPRRLCSLVVQASLFFSENNELTTESCMQVLQADQIQEPWYLRLKNLPWRSIVSYAAIGLNLYYTYKSYKFFQRYQ